MPDEVMEMVIGRWEGIRIIESSIVELDSQPTGFRRLMRPAPATKPAYQRSLPPRRRSAVAEAVDEYTRLA